MHAVFEYGEMLAWTIYEPPSLQAIIDARGGEACVASVFGVEGRSSQKRVTPMAPHRQRIF
tara:strand:+ start:273 stop:455 length:183 start_codon:yes stop_codon:yes gene_type:complete